MNHSLVKTVKTHMLQPFDWMSHVRSVLELVEGQNHSLVKTVKTHMLQPFDWIPTFDVQGHVTLGVLLSANTLQVSFVDSAEVIQPRASLGI